jgi:competence protein ComFC
MLKKLNFNFLYSLLFNETCAVCGKYSGGSYICETCLYSIPRSENRTLKIPFLDGYYSVFSYKGIGKEIFKLAKFEGVKYLLREIGKLAESFLRHYYETVNPDLVTSVPPHPFRLWWSRGYDPVIEMVKATFLRNKVSNILKRHFFSFTALSKVKDLGKRKKLVRGRFKLKEPCAVEGKTVLIVDDVLTSGSTSSEIAKLLKSAGAEKVFLFTFFQRESQ